MKINCEVDTETKSIKVLVDDQEVDLLEFSIGHYLGGCYDDDVAEKRTYISLTQGTNENKYSYSISFSDGKNSHFAESRSVTSVAKEIEKAIGNIIGSNKLSDTLFKKLLKK